MGFSFRMVSGFGFVLSRDEAEDALRSLGVEWDHDEPEHELLDQFEVGVQISECGNAYHENGRRWLFHAEMARDPETGSTQADPKQVAALKSLIEKCALDKTMGFQEEKHLY